MRKMRDFRFNLALQQTRPSSPGKAAITTAASPPAEVVHSTEVKPPESSLIACDANNLKKTYG
jgi:hypothetical protein